MTDRAALLAAVLANPDEDTPRLVYADWLDENGDENDHARARFIRLQCEASRHGPGSRARNDLEREARQVSTQHGKDWGSELEGVVVAGHTDWSRGFVDGVMMYSKRFVADGARVFATQPVRFVKFVDLGARGAVPPEKLLSCPHLARLRTVQFVGQPVDDGFVRVLAECPFLTELRSLRLKRSPISPAALRSIVENPKLPNLRELSVGEHGGSRHLAALASSPEFRRIRMLDCWSCVVGEEGARALAGSEYAAGLESLRITHNREVSGHPPVRGPGAVALAQSPHLRGLKSLALEGQELRKKGAEAFAGAYALPHVQSLSLRGNQIPAGTLPSFAANPAFGSLRRLDLRRNPIRAADTELLGRAFPRAVIVTDDSPHPETFAGPEGEDA